MQRRPSAWPAPRGHERVRPQAGAVSPAVAPVGSGHIAGLDGLRALAVSAVVVFHLWPDVLPGGFLGVTVFFALSGYLITGLLLGELDRTGGVDLRGFVRRRVRRLLPAALATVAVISVVWLAAGWATSATGRELIAAGFQVSNWQRIIDGQQYGIDVAASPVLHFWSLAIEEQIYLVLPLLILVARTPRRIGLVLGVAFAGSVAYTVANAGQATVVYYSTFSRSAEVLAGALVAVWMHGRSRVTPRPTSRAAAVALHGLVVAGAAVLVAAVAFTSLGVDSYYRGGLTVVGVVAAITIGALCSTPRLARLVDRQPLRWIGHRSYGIYLFHWPLLVGFAAAGVSSALLPWLTLAATALVASVSYAWYEQPIRLGVVGGRPVAALLVTLALVTPTVVVLGSGRTEPVTDFAQLQRELDALIMVEDGSLTEGELGDPPSDPSLSASTDPAGAAIDPATVEPGVGIEPVGAEVVDRAMTIDEADRTGAEPDVDADVEVEPEPVAGPVRVGFFGDSKALVLALGLAETDGRVEVGTSFAQMACPVARAQRRRDHRDRPALEVAESCDWTDRIAFTAALNGEIEVAVVWSGTFDVRELWSTARGDRWAVIDDEGDRHWLAAEMRAYLDEIVEHTGARRVLWLTLPNTTANSPNPARIDAYNELVAMLAADHPLVELVDLGTWIVDSGEVEHLLPDGIHPTFGADDGPNSAAEIGERWLLDLVEAAAGR